MHFSLIFFQGIFILHQREPLKICKIRDGVLDDVGEELLFEVWAHNGQVFRVLDNLIMGEPLFEFVLVFGV